MVNDLLDIILITYNRKHYLKSTLDQILSDDSPIKNYDITIYDNKSTDGTSELIEKYKKKFPNIKHVIHKRNIGGNANILRAFENVSKKYFWVICDDDRYDFQDWDKVEDAIKQDKDVIVVEHLTPGKDVPVYILSNELSFLPAAIYKSEFLTDDVINNAYNNIYNYYPHGALVCDCINKKREFCVIENSIIIQNFDKGEMGGYVRGFDETKTIHFRAAHYHLFSGFINTFQMINDKKLRSKCCANLYLGKSFFFSMQYLFNTNGLYRYNVCDILNGISFKYKLIFIWALIWYFITGILHFYKNEKGYYVEIFRLLKLKLISSKFFYFYRNEKGIYIHLFNLLKLKLISIKRKDQTFT